MTHYPEILSGLITGRHKWLVTGAAGFIGSHLAEALLSLGQEVAGLDDFSRGYRENVSFALTHSSFTLIEGSITDIDTCREAVRGCDYVLHHAALASVPESLADPVSYNAVNVSGFVNVLQASREHNVKRVIYASSSAVYGDNETMPKVEGITGKSLSPYALTKYMNEEYAEFFTRVYGLECAGLRYFNVFGPRQDPNGAYAAVIPRWISAVESGNVPVIYGDGTQSRDFCAVQNVVKANLLAAASDEAPGRVFNIGCGVRTSLNELLGKIYAVFAPGREALCVHEPPRDGDILHSSASIELAQRVLNYSPSVYLEEGLSIIHDYQA
ncbi:MAG: SDR family oxidoreductase [Synergistaceae bacterium]|nr:SDR family oxidoreductase [Synergistaceae bacterium]